jgi:hypothetical protein
MVNSLWQRVCALHITFQPHGVTVGKPHRHECMNVCLESAVSNRRSSTTSEEPGENSGLLCYLNALHMNFSLQEVVMPPLEQLEPCVRSRRFWTDYSLVSDPDETRYPDSGDLKVFLPISDSFGLSLGIKLSSEYYYSLNFTTPTTAQKIAWIDGYHWHPHVLRWDELDLLCRAIARLDRSLPHPGLPLLLLYRFAPICASDDVPLVISLLDSAFRSLDLFSDAEIRSHIEAVDCRRGNFRWERDEETNSWFLDQSDEDTDRSGVCLYSVRSRHSERFNHKEWASLIQEAETIAETTKDGESIPDGILPSERPSLMEYTLREEHWIQLHIPFRDPTRPLLGEVSHRVTKPLNRILTGLNIGSAAESMTLYGEDESGEWTDTTALLSVYVYGDLDRALDMIEDTLLWAQAPASAKYQIAYGSKLSLHLEQVQRPSRRLCFQLAKVQACQSESGTDPSAAFETELPASCRESLRGAFATKVEDPDRDGRVRVTTTDTDEAISGEVIISFGRMDDAADSSTGLIEVLNLSLAVIEPIYMWMASERLALLPPAIVAFEVEEMATPKIRPVKSAADLHDILLNGPYVWWAKPGLT